MSESPEIFLKNDTTRKIVHVDMDAFYASVEQRDRPELRGCPIAVGHADGRGVVATASYEARRFGVHSAMPCARAKELCPSLIFVDGRMSHYKEVSKDIHRIFRRYTDVIEPISLDEAFLDVTQNKVGLTLGRDVARAIKNDIRQEFNLVASAGVSYNKFLAKIASDWRKPDGLCTIHPSVALSFIDALPIEAFWGVGPATAKRMHEMGIYKAPDLRAQSLPALIRHFGQSGLTFYQFVRGVDERPVRAYRERKSVGCEQTFNHDISDNKMLYAILLQVCDELVRRLLQADFLGVTLTLKIRFYDFTTKTRSITAETPLCDAESISRLGRRLLDGIEIPARGVRLLGLSVSNSVKKEAQTEGQLALFEDDSF